MTEIIFLGAKKNFRSKLFLEYIPRYNMNFSIKLNFRNCNFHIFTILGLLGTPWNLRWRKMCMSSHIHPISPSDINQHSTVCRSIISRGGGERPPIVQKCPQTPPFPFFSIFFSEMLLVGYIFTMYSYFSLLSSKIKIWQHDKCSNVRKSPQTPPFSSPKSGQRPSTSNFFSEMLLVGYYVLCTYISAFYHHK